MLFWSFWRMERGGELKTAEKLVLGTLKCPRLSGYERFIEKVGKKLVDLVGVCGGNTTICNPEPSCSLEHPRLGMETNSRRSFLFSIIPIL